jgi:hypothetical protein
MRKFSILGIIVWFAFTASAQWRNTTNLFADSLHMPVSFISGEQLNPITIQSFPDSGYFVKARLSMQHRLAKPMYCLHLS